MREKTIHVLLVESDYIDREAAKRYITKKHPSYHLRIAKSEVEAIERLKKAAYDVVLLNREIGNKAGGGLFSHLGATPLIIITDRVGGRIAEEAAQRDACDILFKDRTHKHLEVLPFSIRKVLNRGRTEMALSASLAAFHSVVKNLPHIIYELNADGRIVFISDAVKFYGYNPEALVGSRLIDLVHGDDKKKAAYRVNERRTGDRSTKLLELRLIPKDDAEAPPDVFSLSAEGMYTSEKPDSNSFLGTQGVAMDITEKKEMQKERVRRKRLQRTMEAIRTVCNELSQPLQAILGYSDLLSIESIKQEELPEVISTIVDQTRRMDVLMKKLRKIAKPETMDAGEENILVVKSQGS